MRKKCRELYQRPVVTQELEQSGYTTRLFGLAVKCYRHCIEYRRR